MSGFSFVQITDHHLLESETQLRDGFSPGHALRRVMRHISETVADKTDFIVSTGDLVEPCTDAAYRGAIKLLGIQSSASLPGPQKINVEGLKEYPMYFLPGNHDDRELMTRHLFPGSQALELYNFTFEHKGVQFIFMDWGSESRAFFHPQTRSFLEKAMKSELPSIIICHHHVKRIGSRWLDGFIAEDIDDFWNLVTAPAVKEKILGILCGHAHITYEDEHMGIPILGLRSTAFPFAKTDEVLILLAPPHYRLVTIQDKVLTSRTFEVRI